MKPITRTTENLQPIEQEVTVREALAFNQALNEYNQRPQEQPDEYYGYPIPTFEGFVMNPILGSSRCTDVAYALDKNVITRYNDGSFAICSNGKKAYPIGNGAFKEMPNTELYERFMRLWRDRQSKRYKPVSAMDEAKMQQQRRELFTRMGWR